MKITLESMLEILKKSDPEFMPIEWEMVTKKVEMAINLEEEDIFKLQEKKIIPMYAM